MNNKFVEAVVKVTEKYNREDRCPIGVYISQSGRLINRPTFGEVFDIMREYEGLPPTNYVCTHRYPVEFNKLFNENRKELKSFLMELNS